MRSLCLFALRLPLVGLGFAGLSPAGWLAGARWLAKQPMLNSARPAAIEPSAANKNRLALIFPAELQVGKLFAPLNRMRKGARARPASKSFVVFNLILWGQKVGNLTNSRAPAT